VAEIEMVPADRAADAVLVATIHDLVNAAYSVTERGLWVRDIPRVTPDDVASAISSGRTAIAVDDGRLTGTVRTRMLDAATGWLGVLAVDVDAAGSGLGRQLVAFAEQRSAALGARTMCLEMLVPDNGHPHTDRLAAWYGRLGYREVDRRSLAEFDPDAMSYWVAPCGVAVMHKPLGS
jgi:GNAT superfamily N-acetyltransferase